MSFVLTALMMFYPLSYILTFHFLIAYNDSMELSSEMFLWILKGYILIGILLCLFYAVCPRGKAMDPLRLAIENLLVKLFAFLPDLAMFLYASAKWAENEAASQIEGMMGVGLAYMLLLMLTIPYAIVRITMYSATATVQRRAVKYAHDTNSLSKIWRVLHPLFHTFPVLDIVSAAILCFQLRKPSQTSQDLPALPVTSD